MTDKNIIDLYKGESERLRATIKSKDKEYLQLLRMHLIQTVRSIIVLLTLLFKVVL